MSDQDQIVSARATSATGAGIGTVARPDPMIDRDSATDASSRRGPIPSLDGIRTIAVLIVIVAHAGFQDRIPGGLGVTIFFFLSGYLITTLLLDEVEDADRVSVGRFYLRRAFRLFPSLAVTLVVAYALLAFDVIGGGFSWDGLASQVLYFANYFQIFLDDGSSIPAGTGILWSLAVEEHFYIVFPVAMAVASKVGVRRERIAVAMAVLCVLALAWRLWLATRPGFYEARTYYATDTRFDSILFGCLLALVANPARGAWSRRPVAPRTAMVVLGAALAVLLATILYREEVFRETFRYTVQGLALGPIFYLAVRFPTMLPFRPLNHRWIARIGTLSYGMYLIHYVVLEALGSSPLGPDAPKPVVLAITLAASVAFAAVLDRVVEPTFRRRRAALH